MTKTYNFMGRVSLWLLATASVVMCLTLLRKERVSISSVPSQFSNPIRFDNGEGCYQRVSALVDYSGGQRSFFLPMCNQSYTIPTIFEDFSAHQVEWNIMGKTKAFWSVFVHVPQDDKLITESMKETFYSRGMELVQQASRETEGQFPGWELKGDVLDFGCGIGRLGIAFAQLDSIDSVTCVDQSVHHLKKMKLFTESMPRKAQLFSVISGPDMLSALHQNAEAPKCFDFVHSLISLQHMITPLQAIYLEQLCDVLKPAGVMRIQIPSHTPATPACDDVTRSRYRDSGGMQMHYIEPESVRLILGHRGCDAKIQDVGPEHVGKGHNSIIVHAKKREQVICSCLSQP